MKDQTGAQALVPPKGVCHVLLLTESWAASPLEGSAGWALLAVATVV